MRSLKHPMHRGTSGRRRSHAVGAAMAALLLVGSLSAAYAQDAPPLSIPSSGTLPTRPGDALAAGDWLFYPTVKTYTQYTDNLFQSVLSPVSVWGFGVTPGLIAEWSNGIHTTTLYGNLDARAYPADRQLNVFDPKAGFVQKYSPLPDLTFSVQGDYTHQTISSTLVNAIPGGITSPGTTVLPNGNTVLPNGDVVSPSGQIVGHVAPTGTAANSTFLINPSNQLTGTASVEKILNRGFHWFERIDFTNRLRKYQSAGGLYNQDSDGEGLDLARPGILRVCKWVVCCIYLYGLKYGSGHKPNNRVQGCGWHRDPSNRAIFCVSLLRSSGN